MEERDWWEQREETQRVEKRWMDGAVRRRLRSDSWVSGVGLSPASEKTERLDSTFYFNDIIQIKGVTIVHY